jgi:hypothetical protein
VRSRLLTIALVLGFALHAGVAHAKQDDGLWEQMSGPGPFLRFPSLDIRVACITRVGNDSHTVAIAPWGRGSTSEFGFKPYVAPSGAASHETARMQCSRDENVKGYVTVAYGHYTSLSNNLFANNLTDDQFKVKAESLSVRFMGRTINDVVDLGFGLDMFMFYGKAFDRFTRIAVEPIRISVAPFAAIRNSPRSRAFHLAVAPTIMLGSVDQDDFCNTSACNVVPRQFFAKAETQWATTLELDILTLIRGN